MGSQNTEQGAVKKQKDECTVVFFVLYFKILWWFSRLQGDKSVSVDGKCSDAALLGSLLEELKATLAQC